MIWGTTYGLICLNIGMTIAPVALGLSLLAAQPASLAEVSGTVSYRERMALPAGSEIRLTVSSYSLRGGQKQIAQYQSVTGGKQVPLAFQFSYPMMPTTRDTSIGVIAEIWFGGRVQFQSPKAQMITGQKSSMNLVLHRAMAPTTFIDKNWQLFELNGEKVNTSGRAPSLMLDKDGKTLFGFGGVNRFSGAYSYAAPSLQLDPGAMTLMAGPDDVMELETRYLHALMTVNKSALVEGELHLLRGDKVVARFRLAPAR